MSSSGVSRPRVYVRIRPLNQREKREGKGELCCKGDPRQPDVFFMSKEEGGPELQVRFDQVFHSEATQANVFDHIGPEVLRTLFSGYNASVFAYGQTGSGKTHTMEGDRSSSASAEKTAEEREGLVPRLIQGIFRGFKSNSDITDALVEVSLVQIYQEKIQDLLNNRKQLEIHMDRTSQYVARDATWRTVRSLEECMKLYAEAAKMRATSATDMNLVSSRSHMICMLRMQWDEPALPGSHAQLNMIDLAGSERLNESGATGETMMEAIHINKSLSALGNVVAKLVDQAKYPNRRMHIPYKDSKLTYLLQSSLGGANLVHFVLAVSGSAMWRGETVSTIEFGKRALQLVLRPVRNAIDYTRLAEMEAMIERMRTHIASLEEELQTKRNSEAAGFLQIRQIAQDDDAAGRHRRRRGDSNQHKSHLKRQTELARIVANLPETFDDLTSHCILFPESKVTLREMQGLEKLVHFVEKSASTFYRSNAAQTIASVMDDAGRESFVSIGGMDALAGLLSVREERCKEAACVAIEAVCRGCSRNKENLNADVYSELVELIYGYPNQQVQEAACAAIATIVDGYPSAVRRLENLDVVPKLLETIRTCPEEVVNLTKAATNCVGRLAHGDREMQESIANCGGVDLLIDVLFSPAGARDHQVPILASYALVNLCCSNEMNFAAAREHARYDEVRFRLLEGLARAFGKNASREGFGRATAQEKAGPFPYYGVTVQESWTVASSGGRPIFSTFMDNPQFHFYVRQETDVAFIIQDTLYERRMRRKKKNNSVYMGIAIFEGDAELSRDGLKQLDFHGKMIEIGRYTSNCENVLHCTLPASDIPYTVVPFTSQKGRHTRFALSAFATRPIELTAVPEQTGWLHTVLEGKWTELTGRSGEGFDWRCNPQIALRARDNCRVVFVLSFLSLDKQRAELLQEEEDDDGQNGRPRLHGRLFLNNFANTKRYLKALVPVPQGSTFVASNNFSSNSYVTTAAQLSKGESYVYIPFTELPHQDTYRVSVYCDSDDVDIKPMEGLESEWLCASFSSTWSGVPVAVTLQTQGKMVAVVHSPGAFVRPRVLNESGKKIAGLDSYWNTEAALEFDTLADGAMGSPSKGKATGSKATLTIQAEAMMRAVVPGGTGTTKQVVAQDIPFDMFVFTDQPCTVSQVNFEATPSSWPCPTQSTSRALLEYARVVEEVDAVGAADPDDDDTDSMDAYTDDDEGEDNEETAAERERALEREKALQAALDAQEARNHELEEALAKKEAAITELQETFRGHPDKSPGGLSSSMQLSQKGRDGGKRSSTTASAGTGRRPRNGSVSSGPADKRRLSARPPTAGKTKTAAAAGRRTSSSPVAAAGASKEVRDTIEYTLLKLNGMSRRAATGARGGKAEDWKQMQEDIEDIQRRLFKALEES